MKPQAQVRRRYDVTVSGLTSTLEGPRDIVAMYRQVRRVFSAELSLEIKAIDDEPGTAGLLDNKVDCYYGHH